MEGNYFYHGIYFGSPIEKIEKLLEIIKTGGIKCRRLQGITSPFGFNGDDYISVCSKFDESEYLKYPGNAFYPFVTDNFCFIISPNIDAIKTRYEEIEDTKIAEILCNRMRKNPNERFSNLFDEWQVKDEIKLNNIVGIGIPLQSIYNALFQDSDLKCKYDELIKISLSLGWDIIDTNDYDNLIKFDSKIKEYK